MSLLKNDLTGHYGIRQVIFKGYQPSRECTCQGLPDGTIFEPCLLRHSTSRGVTTDYIVWRKISAKLGMLPKACKVIPRESCLTLNNAMIFPVLNYSAVVWASLTFVCTIFLSLFVLCVAVFFFFISAPFKPATLTWAPLTTYCLKLNKI